MSSTAVKLTAKIMSPPAAIIRKHDHRFLLIESNPFPFLRWSVSRVANGPRHIRLRASNFPQFRDDVKEVALAGDLDESVSDRSVAGEQNGEQTSNYFHPKRAEKESGGQTAKGFSSQELLQALKRYGVAGVLSYGLLNTIYYLTAFLSVWFFFAPPPRGMSYAAAIQRFLKVMAMVWAGSQVTKLARAGGALALAPFVDRGLSWFTIKFKFGSRGKAFAAIAGMCFGLAFLFFGLTVLSS